MKNKTITYVLLLFVLIIWGTIVYKVFFYSEPTEEIYNIDNVNANKTLTDIPDTFSLSLNYVDPFLKESRQSSYSKKENNTVGTSKKKSNNHPSSTNRNVTTNPSTGIVWPKIKYEGMIKNNTNVTAIVSINGSSYFLKNGEKAQDILIQSITNDSIAVSYQKNIKIIKK